MHITDFIKKLGGIPSLSKHEQLINGLVDAIDSNYLKVGDQLPSINNMVDDLGFARKTIVKAYEALKDRGLVESKKTKGYFVLSDKTNVFLKIALLMYSFQRFQQEFYNSLRNELEDRVQIDVFFHHNNTEVFDTIFSNIKGRYGMYVVAPIQNERVKKKLGKIDSRKLIVVDRFIELGNNCTYLTQEFEESTLRNLGNLLPKIKRYNELVLFFRDDLDYPADILKAFRSFVLKNGLKGRVEKNYIPNSVEKGILYLFISDSDLWPFLKDCGDLKWQIGNEIGVLSFNDHIVKEIILGGITTISTNFKTMAKWTAQCIRNQDTRKAIVPTTLRDRGSL